MTNKDVETALAQVAEIHAQISRTEIFRGYRAVTLATVGTLALCAAAVQGVFTTSDPQGAITYWLLVGGASLALCAGDVIWCVLRHRDPGLRAQTRAAVGQFLPTLFAGAAVTAALYGTELALLLPGFWSVFYGLGIVASRPYLPRAVGGVALYFIVIGAVSIAVHAQSASLSSWAMALPFGLGNLLLALVLHLEIERPSEDTT